MSKHLARSVLLILITAGAAQACLADSGFGVGALGAAIGSATNVDSFQPNDVDRSQFASLGTGLLAQTSFQATTGALARGNIRAILSGHAIDQPQASDASIAAVSEIDALHGTAGSDALVSGSTDAVATTAFSHLFLVWFDTVTSFKADPSGSDFHLGLTLNDGFPTSLGADPFVRASSFAFASALSRITVTNALGGGSATDALSVEDRASQNPDGSAISASPARTVTTTLHALNGQSFVTRGSMELTANINTATGTAGARAMDTALFELSSLDLNASYRSASGTVFATAPKSISPVPESSTLALILAGLGAIGSLGRRRASSSVR